MKARRIRLHTMQLVYTTKMLSSLFFVFFIGISLMVGLSPGRHLKYEIRRGVDSVCVCVLMARGRVPSVCVLLLALILSHLEIMRNECTKCVMHCKRSASAWREYGARSTRKLNDAKDKGREEVNRKPPGPSSPMLWTTTCTDFIYKYIYI